MAPVTPSKVLAVGQNYLDHVREQGSEPPGVPLLFAKFPTSVIGPGEEIRWTADPECGVLSKRLIALEPLGV